MQYGTPHLSLFWWTHGEKLTHQHTLSCQPVGYARFCLHLDHQTSCFASVKLAVGR
jgi:hypothetical protein